MPMHGECCEFDCMNRGSEDCQFEDWTAQRAQARATEAKVAAAALADADICVRVAWGVYSQAHLTDEETEDARQEALLAEDRRDAARRRLACLQDGEAA